MKQLIIICVALIAGQLLAVAGGAPVGNWDGASLVQLTIRVVDESFSGGLPGAKIWLLTERDGEVYSVLKIRPDAMTDGKGHKIPIESLGIRALSGIDGSANLWAYFEAGGGIYWDEGKERKEGSWWIRDTDIIVVTRSGYDDFVATLKSLSASETHPLAEKNLTVLVKMKKANQALLPTPMADTPAACAPAAPAVVAADL